MATHKNCARAEPGTGHKAGYFSGIGFSGCCTIIF